MWNGWRELDWIDSDLKYKSTYTSTYYKIEHQKQWFSLCTHVNVIYKLYSIMFHPYIPHLISVRNQYSHRIECYDTVQNEDTHSETNKIVWFLLPYELVTIDVCDFFFCFLNFVIINKHNNDQWKTETIMECGANYSISEIGE